jgi:hypothetical protein
LPCYKVNHRDFNKGYGKGSFLELGVFLESKALALGIFFGIQSFSFRRFFLESKALALGVFLESKALALGVFCN